MSEPLQGSLENLHEVIRKTFNGRGIEASNIVKDIVSSCQDLVTLSDIGKFCHRLRNKSYASPSSKLFSIIKRFQSFYYLCNALR